MAPLTGKARFTDWVSNTSRLLHFFVSFYLSQGAAGRPGQVQTFKTLALTTKTDKVTVHNYDRLYHKYLNGHRLERLKLLEIGLGCDSAYGPGHSLKLWAEYLPYADLYFMEFDRECVEQHQHNWHAQYKSLKKLYTGDQADRVTLEAIVSEHPDHDFDVIVDDGGHTMDQQLTSIGVLWALVKPGGFYVVEDLLTSYIPSAGGKAVGQKGTMQDFIKSSLDYLTCATQYISYINEPSFTAFCATNKLVGLMSVECFSGICVFTKAASENTEY